MDLEFLIQDVRELLAVVVGIVSLTVVFSVASCTHEQQAQVKTVLAEANKGAQAGCILFEKLKLDQDHVEDICLASDGVRNAVADYKKRQAAAELATSASAAASAPPPPPPAAASAPGGL